MARVIRAIYACPNGIYRMSDSMENLVETSSNLAIVKSDGKQIKACALLRSSVDSAKEDFAEMMASVIELAGGEIAGKMTVLAEGDAAKRDDIIYLEYLPLFNMEGEPV